ncbi:MAG: PAS domain-containing protein, partial [Candidatus Lokiarchaeota archaeon]
MEITGYKREEVENWEPGEFLKIIHPKDRDFVIEQAKKKQNGDKSIIKSYNCRGIKKNKENLWVRLYSKTVTYNDKFADLFILLDITER